MTPWPAWATEPVQVRAADPDWQRRGERACRRLEVELAPWLVRPVEHVGSTSVPGLPAKPILDLQAAVGDLACSAEVSALLGPAGWHLVPPELDDRPWRRFLVLVERGSRSAHLHLMVPGDRHWHDQLAFRDALRRDADLARRYAELKTGLAARHPDDREAYTAGKPAFVAAVLRVT